MRIVRIISSNEKLIVQQSCLYYASCRYFASISIAFTQHSSDYSSPKLLTFSVYFRPTCKTIEARHEVLDFRPIAGQELDK